MKKKVKKKETKEKDDSNIGDGRRPVAAKDAVIQQQQQLSPNRYYHHHLRRAHSIIPGQRIFGKHLVLVRELARGGFGSVYEAARVSDPRRRVAVKIEHSDLPLRFLAHEHQVYMRLQGGAGIPWVGRFENVKLFVSFPATAPAAPSARAPAAATASRVPPPLFQNHHHHHHHRHHQNRLPSPASKNRSGMDASATTTKTTICRFDAMVMELFDLSLDKLFDLCGHRFSLKTVLMLADQLLARLELMHSRGMLHRDIKPGNILFGRGPAHGTTLFLVDFGLSKPYVLPCPEPPAGTRVHDLRLPEADAHRYRHIPYRKGKPMVGTARYASLGMLSGQEQGRRDDLEALGYVLVYLVTGSLPWLGAGVCRRTKRETGGNDDVRSVDDAENAQAHTHAHAFGRRRTSQMFRIIRRIKADISPSDLCDGLPPEFARYIEYCRNMEFAQTPDYTMLRTMFRDRFVKCGFVWDNEFDWMIPVPLRTSALLRDFGGGGDQQRRDDRNGKKEDEAAVAAAAENEKEEEDDDDDDDDDDDGVEQRAAVEKEEGEEEEEDREKAHKENVVAADAIRRWCSM